jgi:hypothetical protein
MSEFSDIIGVPYTGVAKSKEEIRATTGKEKRPANYKYGEKLPEWDSSLPIGAEDLLTRCEPRNDRMLVRLMDEMPKGAILLTDAKPLIGGCRKATVLKVGPGKWIPGEWWYTSHSLLEDGADSRLDTDIEFSVKAWVWIPGYRRPVAVHPGETVLIGNWTDLEANGLALCMEGDVRSIWLT